jgi:hypothetical protein
VCEYGKLLGNSSGNSLKASPPLRAPTFPTNLLLFYERRCPLKALKKINTIRMKSQAAPVGCLRGLSQEDRCHCEPFFGEAVLSNTSEIASPAKERQARNDRFRNKEER